MKPLTEWKFTPYELGIILHYYVSAEEHPPSPIFTASVNRLIQLDLMLPSFRLTERGKAFVELGLMQTLIPQQVWQMPGRVQS